MEVIIQPTAEAATAIAVCAVADLLRRKPNAVLGLATGSTPLLLYQALATMDLDWGKVTTFNLDEYIGVSASDSCSYHSFMEQNLFSKVNIRRKNVHIPDGMTNNIPHHCEQYEKKIRDSGGIDLQVLGIGSDGHIGFNEPCSSLSSRTRIKTLTEHTREQNARFFQSPTAVPHHVITMGIGTIMEARVCMLLAFGANKSRAIAAAVEGPITSMSPASILQMHPQAKACLDNLAASRLKQLEYYKSAYEHKPEWQKA
jgi:glucosamine-6-phosphate deaminase